MRCAILKLASEPPMGLVRLLSLAIQGGNQVEHRIAPHYGWGNAQDSFCTLWQRLFLCHFFFVLRVFRLSFLGIWRAFTGAGKFFSVSARDDLWRFQRSAILDHCRVTSSFGLGSSSSSSSCLLLTRSPDSTSPSSIRTSRAAGACGTG